MSCEDLRRSDEREKEEFVRLSGRGLALAGSTAVIAALVSCFSVLLPDSHKTLR